MPRVIVCATADICIVSTIGEQKHASFALKLLVKLYNFRFCKID